jgi:radical SAM protein with 4Fe4S-binding SPASM domain
MEMETVERIVEQTDLHCKSNIRVDFAVHGEPLLHPEIVEIVEQFREGLPQSQLTIISNGDVIARKKEKKLTRKLFGAGLNYLLIDYYDYKLDRISAIKKVMARLPKEIEVLNFYDDDINPWSYRGFDQKAVILCDSISSRNKEKRTREVHTAGSNLNSDLYPKYNISPSSLPKKAKCTKPYKELTINYDGNVSLCCEDWQRQIPIGSILNQSIPDIWEGKAFQMVRWLLHHKRRDLINICAGCNERSFRVGLFQPEVEFEESVEVLSQKLHKLIGDKDFQLPEIPSLLDFIGE